LNGIWRIKCIVSTIIFKCKKSKINVKTSIAIAETGPIILMQSTRKITYGEELLYDYNGAFESYNTSAFE
jgi:hypothetical protein